MLHEHPVGAAKGAIAISELLYVRLCRFKFGKHAIEVRAFVERGALHNSAGNR
jgi:hypothetical protein